MIVYLARNIPAFVMYCVNGESGSSLLIESTDSMITTNTISGMCVCVCVCVCVCGVCVWCMVYMELLDLHKSKQVNTTNLNISFSMENEKRTV